VAKEVKKTNIKEQEIENPYKDITFAEFFNNPGGKKAAYFVSQEVVKQSLEKRTLKLMKEHKNIFPIFIYADDNLETIYIHLKIPSEKVTVSKIKIFYDVVFEFTKPEKKKLKFLLNLKNYHVRFFCNAPSFNFSYAYLANQYKLIPEFLLQKCSSIALETAPSVRNPSNRLGFEKYLFFARNYIMYKGYYKLNNIKKLKQPILLKEILKNVDHTDKKLEEYQSREADHKKKVNRIKILENLTGAKTIVSGKGKLFSKKISAQTSNIKKLKPRKKLVGKKKK